MDQAAEEEKRQRSKKATGETPYLKPIGKIHVDTIEKSLLAQGLLTQQTPMIKGGKLVGLPRVKNI